jgi:hypothetical protein
MMHDPDAKQRMLYMIVGGICIYFGVQYFGLSIVAFGKLAGMLWG